MADENTEKQYDDLSGGRGQSIGEPNANATDGKPRKEPTKTGPQFPIDDTPRGGFGCPFWIGLFLLVSCVIVTYALVVWK